MKKDLLPQGADICESSVRYRIWAPEVESLSVEISSPESRSIPLTLDASGYFQGYDDKGAPGDLYKYRFPDGQTFPDPASRWQPDGVHGVSAVIDPAAFQWHDREWKSPSFRDLVIYELHIGTFTPEGTFLSAIEKLPHIRDLGANAIEIMPVGDFPGEYNWGYDGVSIYAPARCYGHPDDLRALVDAAHQLGLTVILDVVYNHFGPDGNYLGAYSSLYFNERRKTPWGASLNFDQNGSNAVRSFFLSNPIYWMEEFHIDGFRLDATHAISDRSPKHILEEIVQAIHEHGGFAIAEDARNESRLLLTQRENGYAFNGVWADDFHHTIRVSQTREAESYFADYKGTLEEVIETLSHGWLYRGQYSSARKGNRGTESRHIPPERFVHCIMNHDQTGNQAFGLRLNEMISPEGYRAASMLLCLTPYTPMLFMGQEWAAATPFLFFTDHNDQLGPLVTKGRREEFKDFAAFSDAKMLRKIPDPQKKETFEQSKLNWDEIQHDKLAMLQLYKKALSIRHSDPAFRPVSRDTWETGDTGFGIGAMRLKGQRDWLMLFNLTGSKEGTLPLQSLTRLSGGQKWQSILSSNSVEFGGNGGASFDPEKQRVQFEAPETLLLVAES